MNKKVPKETDKEILKETNKVIPKNGGRITMTKDLTNGNPMKLILNFAIPLLFGFLFQQFYNLVDTMIVGRFLGVDDLAAVGATGSINFLVIGFCMGVCNGFAIPVSHKFGAQDYVGMRKYVANCVWLGIIFSVVMTVATAVLCRDILIWMRTPENIIEGAYEYIFIIFLGIPTVYLYNIVAGVIRATGDSKTPVIFLVLSSVINIVLDLYFIISLHMGVAGAAWATVISQGVSGVACLIYMVKKFEVLRIRKEEWAMDGHMMLSLCGMGVPMGLQYSITAIGSIVLTTAVNGLGSVYVAAQTAAGRVSCFFCTVYDALGSTMATYGGQNVGAKKLGRLNKGLKCASLIGTIYSLAVFVIMFFYGRPFAALFVSSAETEILDAARLSLVIGTVFYVPLAFVNIVRFLFQGMGYPMLAIFAGVFEMIGRIAAAVFLVPIFGFTGVCVASPIAWILADAFLFPAYFHVRKKTYQLYHRDPEGPDPE